MNLAWERRTFARGGFTTSYGRVAEQTYRTLLFDGPANWEYELLAPGNWLYKPDEIASARDHRTEHHRLFVPPSVPLVNRHVQAAWQRYGLPRSYLPHMRSQRYDLLQYTSEFPWGDSPLAPVECFAAMDFYPARVDPSFWEPFRARMQKHSRSLWLTAISESTRQDAIRFLDIAPERVRTIYLAVDHEVYREQPAAGDDECAHRWELPSTYVLYVGSVALRKNVITLVGALEAYNERTKQNIPLLIAGNVLGANYLVRRRVWNQITRVARRTPVRQLKHPTDLEMACFYRRALMVVHPSLFEGFGFTVLEAMASGAPVICGRHTSLIEVGGNAARFVEDSRNVEELAGAIADLAESDVRRSECKRLGIAQAEKFRWDTFARQTIQFYQDALAAA